MPDLNETVLPVVWTLVHRALAQAPSSRADLVARLTPFGLIDRAREDGSRHVRPSITALMDAGCIVAEGEGGELRLAAGLDDERKFRAALRRAYLDVPLHADVWAPRDDAGGLQHHAQVAVAWLCLQGVVAPLTNWAAASEVLSTQLGPDRPLMRSDVPYNTLERLATWLGVARSFAGRLIPDPTEVVARACDAWIPIGEERPMRAIVERAAEEFPWMPHGATGRSVAARMTIVPDTSGSSGRCPQCLSIALLRLEAAGVLRLREGDDANDRVALSLPGGDERAVAQVSRG